MRVTTPKILMNLGLLLCFVLSINGAQIYFGNAGSYSVFEGDFNALTSIDVDVCHSPSDTISTAYISTNNSTAGAGSDFEAIGSNTLVKIPAGESCIFYTIGIISDVDPELTEQFYVQLSPISPSDQLSSGLGTATVTINDDDNPSEVEVSFLSDTYEIVEGDVPGQTSVAVYICHTPSDIPTTAYVSSMDGSAMDGSDFSSLSLTAVTITGSCSPYLINIVSDENHEETEEFHLHLSSAVPSVKVSQERGSTTITINDDDDDDDDDEGVDSLPPTIIGCPSNILRTVTTNDPVAEVVTWSEPTANDACCGQITVPSFRSHAPGSTFTLGTTSVIYTFSDLNNNVAACSFTVTIEIETSSQPCESSPCQNEANCVTENGGYTCQCVTGFFGTNCETHFCSLDICKNGGTCVLDPLSLNGYSCHCAPAFSGPTCSEMVSQACNSSPCQNEGTCMNEENGYMCQCATGFTGTNCETQMVTLPCYSSPCQNGGTCMNEENGYMCQCLTGFSGTNCETEMVSQPCDPSPCQNEGTCMNEENGYTCQCATGFTGTNCETRPATTIGTCPGTLDVTVGSTLSLTSPSCFNNMGHLVETSECSPGSGDIIQTTQTGICFCPSDGNVNCVFQVTVSVLILGNRVKRAADGPSNVTEIPDSETALTTVIYGTDDISTTAMAVTTTTTVAPGTTPSIAPTTTELNTTPLSSTVLATTVLYPTSFPSTVTTAPELETTSLPIILTTTQELDTTPFIPSTVPVTPDLDTTLLPSTVPTTPVISNCKENPGICGENATCENITDGIQCKCNEGFSPSGPFTPTNSTICVDTNECMISNECVPEGCINTIGSYKCTCPPGYYESGLKESGRQNCTECNRGILVKEMFGLNCSRECTCATGATCAADTGHCTGNSCGSEPLPLTCDKDELDVVVTTPLQDDKIAEGATFKVKCSVNLLQSDVRLSWTGPNGDIMSGGRYDISSDHTAVHGEVLQVMAAEPTDTGMYNCTATLLEPTETVTKVTGSIYITVLDLPEIAGLHITSTTSSSIFLGWTIADDGGDTLTCRANYTADGTDDTQLQSCSGNETCELSGLSSYTLYNITVECRNTAGYSNALTTPARTDTSAPTAPKNALVENGDENCIVRWEEPELSNGPGLDYEVNKFIEDAAKGVSDERSDPVEIKTGTKYEQEKANMKLNSIYTFEICANNDDHRGECVNASGSCTTNPGAPDSIPTIATPDQERDVSSTSVTIAVPQVDNRNGPISCYEFVVVKSETGYASSDKVGFEDIQNKSGENGLPYRSVVMNHDQYISKETVTIGSETNTKTTCMLVASRRRRRANTVEGGKQLTAINSPLESDTSYDIFMRSYSETSGGMFQYASSEFVNVSTNPGDGSAGLIVSLIILILLIIVVSIVLFIFWQKRNSPDKTHSVVLPMVTTTNGGGADHFDGKNKGFEDDEMISEVPPINIDQLGESILEKHKQSDKLFFAEFRSLMSTNPEATIEAFNNVANKDKNRYINIPCYDHSRVKLNKIGGDENSDYINANYVDGYSVPEKFIAAQGPKEETVEDFWRMIWEQKTKTIIMLTRCFESGRDKCFQYWPDSGQVTHGKFTVCLDNTLECPDYVIRQFRLSMNKESDEDDDGESETRTVMQFHFLAWPDHGVPEYPYAMLAFIKRIRQMTQNKPEKGQIVIHCSAGVGRTGTYITIDAMLDRLNEEKTVDIFNYIQKIRLQRSTLVQSQVQYVFIYHALHEEHLYGHTEVRLNDLKQYFRRLKLKTLQDDNSPLHIEFKTAATLPVKDTSTKEASKLGNKEKNRIRNYLPYDKNRVNLERLVGDEDSTYINASYINGYERRNMYIITQAPMENTASDFWRMVWDSLTSTVVMLTDLEEKGNEMCVKFWPEEEPKTFGNLTIELTEQEEEESFTIKDFTMSNNQGVSGRKVRMYQFHGWPEIGVPDCDSVTHLVTLSHEYQRVAEEEESVDQSKHPIIVFCHTGVGRTAIWCALSILLERAKAEGVVDVFQTVRTLRQQRQHMVQDTTQYEFLYQAVLSHLGKLDDLYENLQS